MTQQELEKLYINTNHGLFTPVYEYSDYILNEETNEYEYTGLLITKTSQEVYDEWLYNKDHPQPPQPDKISILEKEMEDLKSSQMGQDFIIDDLVFEVIPMLETQINIVRDSGNGEDTPVLLPSVMANKIINNNKKEGGGMAAYLAKKIIDGRDYIAVFRTLSYKMYQEEVNTILELEGHGNLIKR